MARERNMNHSIVATESLFDISTGDSIEYSAEYSTYDDLQCLISCFLLEIERIQIFFAYSRFSCLFH
jgi:hypothetical protein